MEGAYRSYAHAQGRARNRVAPSSGRGGADVGAVHDAEDGDDRDAAAAGGSQRTKWDVVRVGGAGRTSSRRAGVAGEGAGAADAAVRAEAAQGDTSSVPRTVPGPVPVPQDLQRVVATCSPSKAVQTVLDQRESRMAIKRARDQGGLV